MSPGKYYWCGNNLLIIPSLFCYLKTIYLCVSLSLNYAYALLFVWHIWLLIRYNLKY